MMAPLPPHPRRPENRTMDPSNPYFLLLERVILNLRMRIRYGEDVSLQEIHELLDAVHNIPPMLREQSEWYNPDNINFDLALFDRRWCKQGDCDSTMRISLIKTLNALATNTLYQGEDESPSHQPEATPTPTGMDQTSDSSALDC